MTGNQKTDAGDPMPMQQSYSASGALEISSILSNSAVYHGIQIINA